MRRERITQRLNQRLQEGLIEEVQHLLQSGISADDLIFYGLEYKYITLFLLGKMDYSSMAKELTTAIHQFAKRQMTWYRSIERKGNPIHWIDGTLPLLDKIQEARIILSK